MGIDYNLTCDACGKTIDGSIVSVAAVRRRAKQEGTAHRYREQDLCTLCFAATFKTQSGAQEARSR